MAKRGMDTFAKYFSEKPGPSCTFLALALISWSTEAHSDRSFGSQVTQGASDAVVGEH
jgi:hypothetical protein